MSTNAFINKFTPPTDADLAQEFEVNIHEWKCHSPKWGWSLRVKRKARTIVWLSPSAGQFIVLFIFGRKAMLAARRTKVPQRVARAMDEAAKWPEGSGVRLQVRSSRDIAGLMKLATIKLAH